MCTYTNKWLSNTSRAGPCRGKIDFCLKLMALNLSKETWSFLFWWSCDTMNNKKTHCTGWFWTHFQTKSSAEQCKSTCQLWFRIMLAICTALYDFYGLRQCWQPIKKHTHCSSVWQPITNKLGRAQKHSTNQSPTLRGVPSVPHHRNKAPPKL